MRIMNLSDWLYWYLFIGGILSGYVTGLVYRDDEVFWVLMGHAVGIVFLSIFWLPLALLFVCYFIYHLVRGLLPARKKTDISNP